MKIFTLPLLCIGLQICAVSQTTERPHITGIDHVSFYTTNIDGAKKLYSDVLGLPSTAPIEPGQTTRFISGTQWVGYSPAPDSKATDRMDHTAFTTDNLAALRSYLLEKGFKPSQIEGQAGQASRFAINDPEGHRLEFVQRAKGEIAPNAPAAVSHRMIHVGFLVYDRVAEDHFYRDVLGFRPYWHGGMKDNQTDWVSLQVPDGSDWLEYMLNQPAHPDLQLTGVMNHISFGVSHMKRAQALMESHGWRAHGDEHAQLGRDGKWQLNVFDPDSTRVELMEFKPASKPCCSDFTAAHPTE